MNTLSFFETEGSGAMFHTLTIIVCAGLLFMNLAGAWISYRRILPREYAPWRLPEGILDANKRVLLDNMHLVIKISAGPTGEEETPYVTSASGQMKLGKVFHYFIASENKDNTGKIETKDAYGNSYAWQFYAVGFSRTDLRRLDPEWSLRSNRLKNNSIVKVVRAEIKKENNIHPTPRSTYVENS
ncbi:MAG: hypothetical protein H7Y03_11985 [Chitinophagaceae bacterium]|nr:hypothetical protein [Chitinophagaceae bacterium]